MALSSEERVRILASTCLDYLPGPRTWSGQLARSANPRPVTQEVAPCTLCLGRGRMRGGNACLICPSQTRYHPSQRAVAHHCTPCLVCDGSGWRKRRRGEEPYDVMTGYSRSELAVAAEAPASTRIASHPARDEGDSSLERARKARDRSGSYQEFERAMEKLRSYESPVGYHLVWHTLVCGEPVILGPGAQHLLDEAVVWLAREMRHHRVPGWAIDSLDQREARKRSLHWGRTVGHERQRGVRNAAIRQAVEEGQKISAVAREFGLARETVSRILHRK